MSYLDFSGTFLRADLFVDAAIMTIVLSAIATVLGMIVGIIGAALRLSGNRILSAVSAFYVELIRNTPFLVQIYIVYFGLPAVGVRITAFNAAILSLTLYAGAYITEIVRAGVLTVDKGRSAAHLGRGADLPPCRAGAGAVGDLPGAHQPVRPHHARLRRRLGHLGARADRRRQRHPGQRPSAASRPSSSSRSIWR